MAAQIIRFPVQNSNGYNNLAQLFEICDSLESCNFYLESVEQLFQKGYISEKEMYTLRRIGRGKRLELTQPEEQEPKRQPNLACISTHRRWEAQSLIARWRRAKDIMAVIGLLIRHWKSKVGELRS